MERFVWKIKGVLGILSVVLICFGVCGGIAVVVYVFGVFGNFASVFFVNFGIWGSMVPFNLDFCVPRTVDFYGVPHTVDFYEVPHTVDFYMHCGIRGVSF